MPTTRKPRNASLQFWPRKRAESETARVRSWAENKNAKPSGFAGYKAGMTHILVNDARPNSKTKNQTISLPVTVIECPSLKVAGVSFYKTKNNSSNSFHIFAEKLDKELSRTIASKKKQAKKIDDIKPEDFEDLKIIVNTQPKLTGIGKKKPEIFEISVGGSKDDKLGFAKEKLGKEIQVSDVFDAGQHVDIHSVTKGKGVQGPVRRHGISLKSHKSEKSRRAAVLGSEGDSKVRFYAHQAGQTGYHLRTEHNKWLMKIGEPKEVNPKGGFLRYGNLKNSYVLLKGSVGGPAKRLIRFNIAARPTRQLPKEAPLVEFISTSSRQGK